MEEFFLGIDVGGTNVKIGLVKADGTLISKQKVSTNALKKGDFVENFVSLVGNLLRQFPEVSKVGMGLPGTLGRKRKRTIDLPNLPELSNVKLHDILSESFPSVSFFLENDANAAALGEFHFSGQKLPDNVLVITMGTGIGSAAIINRKLFKGGNGNAMELGHIVASNGQMLEQTIGKDGLLRMAHELMADFPDDSTLKAKPDFDAEDVEDAARKGDALAAQVFARVGTLLGEGLVSAIRLLDINTILIGGGVSKVFPHVRPTLEAALHKFLPPYYTDAMDIRLAVLGNNAGIIGAASLCLKESRD